MVTHECIIPYSTSRGMLTGLYPHCCNSTTSVVSEPDHWARYQVVVSCTTGQYHDIALATCQGNIQYIALAVALIYVIGGIQYYVGICGIPIIKPCLL